MNSLFKQRERWLALILLFYVVALHTSMALMEIFAWSLCLAEIVRLGRIRRWPAFPAWKPILGLSVCIAVGLILNPGGRGFFFQLGFMRWAFLLYLIPLTLEEVWSDKFERRLLQVWLAMAALSAIYALFQTATGIDLIRPAANVISQSRGIFRPTGFFSRSLAFAYSFGISLIAVSLPAWKRWPKWWTGVFFATGLMTLLATEARGAWFGVLAALALYLAVEHRRYLAFFAIVTAVIIGVVARTQNEVGVKIQNLLSLTLDHSSSMRWHLWQAYWQMWKEHPFFGVGLSQGDLLVPTYYQQLGIQEEFASNAHNVYLQWLAGAGIFALFFYFWLCTIFLWKAWKLRDQSPWGWSILMAQIFLHVGALTENNFFTAITNHILIFTWAVLLMLEKSPAIRAKSTVRDL